MKTTLVVWNPNAEYTLKAFWVRKGWTKVPDSFKTTQYTVIKFTELGFAKISVPRGKRKIKKSGV